MLSLIVPFHAIPKHLYTLLCYSIEQCIVQSILRSNTMDSIDETSTSLETQMRLYLKDLHVLGLYDVSHPPMSQSIKTPSGDCYKSISFTELLPSHRKFSCCSPLHIFRRYTEPVSFLPCCALPPAFT